MASDKKTFRVARFDDGTYAVLRTDLSRPQILEVVALFYDATRARKYADIENEQSTDLPIELPASPSAESATAAEDDIREANGAEPRLTARQSAVLEALREKAGDDKIIEMKAAELAEPADIPLGSVHSVIQSLEKKKLIQIARSGSPQSPAAYQLL